MRYGKGLFLKSGKRVHCCCTQRNSNAKKGNPMKNLCRHILLSLIIVFPVYSQISFQSLTGMEGTLVKSIARDSAGNLYCCGNGIFKSTDGGAKWMHLNSIGTFNCMAISKSNTVFAGSYNGGLYRSLDGGAQWAAVGGGLYAQEVYFVTIDSAQNVFVGSNIGLFRSADAGLTFTQANFPNNYVYDLDINADGWLFAATGAGIFSSSDRGSTWIYRIADFHNVRALKKNAVGTYFAVTSDGIFRSTDRCSTWTLVNSESGGQSFALVNGSILFCATFGTGVLRSTDNGATWEQANNGLTVQNIRSILSLPNGDLFSGSMVGVSKSTDSGASWVRKNSGLGTVLLRDFVVDSKNNYYAATAGGVMWSSDRGSTWSGSNTGFTYTDVWSIKVSPTGSLFASNQDALFRSTDKGITWMLMNSGIPEASPESFIALPNGTLIASSVSEVYRSTNNGDSWDKVSQDNSFGPVTCFAVDPAGTIFAIQEFRVLCSGDDGQNWKEQYRGFYRLYDIAINGVGQIFVAGDYNGVLRSLDGGVHWTPVGLNGTSLLEATVSQNGYVYVSDIGGSLYQSTNNGKVWTEAYKGFPSRIIRLCADTSGYLIAVTVGQGIFRSTNPISPTLIPNLFIASDLALDRKRISQHYDTTLTIYNIGNGPLEIYSVVSTNPRFAVQNTAFSIPAHSVYKDTVHFETSVLGPQSASLLLYQKSGSQAETVTASAIGFGIPRIHLSTDTVRLGFVDLGSSKDTSINILNVGDDSLKIVGTTFSPSVFSAGTTPAAIAPGGSSSLFFRFTPQNSGVIAGKMVVASNAESQSDTLRLIASGHPVSIMAYSPRRIDFGTVLLGKKKDTTVSIQNTGTDTLRIRQMISNDSAFVVAADSFAIQPKYSKSIAIRYQPIEYGKDSTTLLIVNNSRRSVDTIFVRGSGDTTITLVGRLTDLPHEFILCQNFPNPFNPSTVIKFVLPKDGFVQLEIFNSLGQECASLIHERMLQGEHVVTWNAEGLPGGAFFCRLRYGAFVDTKKLILLR